MVCETLYARSDDAVPAHRGLTARSAARLINVINRTMVLIAHRGYIWRAAVHDFRHRYAGTSVGFMWNVIHPLALIVLFTVIFSTLMPISFESDGTHFPFVLYLCCGLLPWLAFADCVGRTTSAFVDNASFLKRLPLPEQVFVAKTALSSGLNLALYYVILIVMSI